MSTTNIVLNAECSLIGCIMTDESVFEAIAPMVTEDDFQAEKNKKIFRAAAALHRRGAAIDPIAVIDIIGKEYTQYITEAIAVAPAVHNATLYAQLVKKAANQHKIKAVCEAITCAASDTELNKLMTALQTLCNAVASIESEQFYLTSGDMMEQFYDYRAAADSGKSGALKTGFSALDAMLGGGFAEGGLYILAARTGMGKTTFALSIADAVAKRGEPVLFVSLEMDPIKITAKRLARVTGIDYSRLLHGQLETEEYRKIGEGAKELAKNEFRMPQKSSATLDDLRKWARHLEGIRLLVVDHFGLLTSSGRHSSRYDAMTEISRGIKLLAQELNVPILLIAQFNRDIMYRDDLMPRFTDLRDTGALEQDADGLLFLHRKDYYNSDYTPENGPVETNVIIAKNRHGSPGTVNFDFYPHTGKFVKTAIADNKMITATADDSSLSRYEDGQLSNNI